MLELLATHTIVSGDDASTLTDVSAGVQALHADGLGVVGACGTLGGFALVQWDGTAYRRADSVTAKFVLDLQQPGQWLAILGNFNAQLAPFNPFTCAVGETLESGPDNYVAQLWARAADRYLTFTGALVQYKALDLTGGWTTEATMTGVLGSPVNVSRSRNPNAVWIAYDGGSLIEYDVLARAQTGRSAYVGACLNAWYSVKHDVFVVRAAVSSIKVFASAVRPATLSNPAVSAGSVTKGQACELRVRLLGANSEACAGELVDWSLTSGGGALDLPQSPTDADGYAYNTYIAPVASTGSVSVQAQVLF